MVLLTKLDGQPLALNVLLIARVEATPGTVVTLVDGEQCPVAEPVDEVLAKLRRYQASVLMATSTLRWGHDVRPRLRAVAGERAR